MRLYFSLFFLILVISNTGDASKAENRLYRDILNSYVKLVRPVRNPKDALRVSMKVFLQQILSLDGKNQIMEVNAWLKYVWIDYRLSWDPRKYDNITSIRFAGGENQIWRPDVLLYNSANEDFDSTFKSNEVVYNTGEVNWVPPGIFKASCKMDITYFPFDDQICYLKFGSWTYHGMALDLHIFTEDEDEPRTMDLSTYTPSGEWNLIKAPAIRELKYTTCCPEPYSTVTFYMFLRRRTLFYLFNIVFPSLLISVMTLMGFCLPAHDMSEKIGYHMFECCPPSRDFYFQSIDSADTLPLPTRPRPLLKKMHSVPAEHLNLDRKVGDGILRKSMEKSFKRTTTFRFRRMAQFEKYIRRCIVEANLKKTTAYCDYTLMVITYYQQIDAMIKYLQKGFERQRHVQIKQEEWKFAAMALDRLCLVLVSIFIIACLHLSTNQFSCPSFLFLGIMSHTSHEKVYSSKMSERRIDVNRSNYSVIDNEFGNMRDRFEQEMHRVEEEMRRLRSEFEGMLKMEISQPKRPSFLRHGMEESSIQQALSGIAYVFF
ncbi:unnamed protein product [Caenorhabditis auriculariae]|uniref:Neurotransmitter-gated ion-channel ligand-binding domain-containing protein n=1 Tax=Caenorhabditis auriculariae TaxID=2777116 RepID=A0A8S1H531_9PELO|nr:unnamed protein product [Caenorhabditis auriculariae]